VQLAAALGAEVIATCSAADRDFVACLGASTVIDYASKKFENHARDIDVVIDTVGGETLRRSAAVLRPGGIPVGVAEPPDTEQRRPVRYPRRLLRCQARPGAAHPDYRTG
jgi:NADPH:quinone reductase-like Zn-dependent oxidoreductase